MRTIILRDGGGEMPGDDAMRDMLREFCTQCDLESRNCSAIVYDGTRIYNVPAADLLLVFGTVDYAIPTGPRIIEFPSLNDPRWTPKAFAVAAQYVTSGSKVDLDISFRNGRLTARNLIPF